MSNNHPSYHITYERQGDHLRVHITGDGDGLEITVETEPGKTSDEDALDAAQVAIIKWHLAEVQREQETIKV